MGCSQSNQGHPLNGTCDKSAAMHMFSGEQLPIKKKMTEAFGVFNKFYSSVPSASIPNHMYTQSATSCGLHDNIGYNSCGGPAASWGFPQLTIYDSLSLHNLSFGATSAPQ